MKSIFRLDDFPIRLVVEAEGFIPEHFPNVAHFEKIQVFVERSNIRINITAALTGTEIQKINDEIVKG